jgi:hypothetical protein
MARKGLYRDWVEGEGLDAIYKWAKFGLSDEQIAHNIGLKSPSTFYEWKKRFPKFSEAIKKGRAVSNIELENAMYDMATGKCYEETTRMILDVKTGKPIRIEKITKKLPPNPTMQIFLAKNRMPDRYKNDQSLSMNQEGESMKTTLYLPEKEALQDE